MSVMKLLSSVDDPISRKVCGSNKERVQERLADRITDQADQRAPNQLSDSQLQKQRKAAAQAEYERKRQYHKQQDFWNERRCEEVRRYDREVRERRDREDRRDRDIWDRDDKSSRRSRPPVRGRHQDHLEVSKSDKRDDRAEPRLGGKSRLTYFTGCFNCDKEGHQAKDCPEKKKAVQATKTRGMGMIRHLDQVQLDIEIDTVDGYLRTGEQTWLVAAGLPYDVHFLMGFDTQASLMWASTYDMDEQLHIIPNMDPCQRCARGIHCRHSDAPQTPDAQRKSKRWARGGSKQRMKRQKQQLIGRRDLTGLQPPLTWCGSAIPSRPGLRHKLLPTEIPFSHEEGVPA
ncbi:hypothetical protein SARC_12711 [Sphaeroforma arctica JP610]|uniref:CCHC-type domain-containing protein n=1 Tax=Sphaeroforma arctica JP610 TaxID=667725 RepID=A0A0L0FDD0_9EUKA|nr:hypothetical protein SARC_12711 [Sphaeroforma arctica JP610]KNC74750.1 hypothetical protein SARC_12711 [Sphaeroforma arctica JP610]|eukprot:XP_014148652.1 hypothetical protein SARC_12711 [Sphaeroforma arctica JP610]